MKRLLMLVLTSVILVGCAKEQSKINTIVPTVYADGTELVVLKMPAMS
jgi:uncharacterized protein YcfL